MTDSVSIKEWYAPGGGMMYNVWGLEPDHFMHPYNQIKDQGLRPEDFGVQHPYTERFKKYSRDELIENIIELEKTIESLGIADAAGYV